MFPNTTLNKVRTPRISKKKSKDGKSTKKKVSSSTTSSSPTSTARKSPKDELLLTEKEVGTVFENIHHNQELPPRLKFKVISVRKGGKLSPPQLEFKGMCPLARNILLVDVVLTWQQRWSLCPLRHSKPRISTASTCSRRRNSSIVIY